MISTYTKWIQHIPATLINNNTETQGLWGKFLVITIIFKEILWFTRVEKNLLTIYLLSRWNFGFSESPKDHVFCLLIHSAHVTCMPVITKHYIEWGIQNVSLCYTEFTMQVTHHHECWNILFSSMNSILQGWYKIKNLLPVTCALSHCYMLWQ